MRWHRLGEVENVYAAYNFCHFAILIHVCFRCCHSSGTSTGSYIRQLLQRRLRKRTQVYSSILAGIHVVHKNVSVYTLDNDSIKC